MLIPRQSDRSAIAARVGAAVARVPRTRWTWGVAMFFIAFWAIVLAAADRRTESEPAQTKSNAEQAKVTASGNPKSDTVGGGSSPAPQRLREGTELSDQLGQFRDTGDRIVFQARDLGVTLPTLENLALERVARVLEEARPVRTWSVSGVVTEYRGGNYLLITRALLTAKESATRLPRLKSERLPPEKKGSVESEPQSERKSGANRGQAKNAA